MCGGSPASVDDVCPVQPLPPDLYGDERVARTVEPCGRARGSDETRPNAVEHTHAVVAWHRGQRDAGGVRGEGADRRPSLAG